MSRLNKDMDRAVWSMDLPAGMRPGRWQNRLFWSGYWDNMKFYGKIKQKVQEGFLKEVGAELRWLWGRARAYRGVISVRVLLDVLSVVLGLGGSLASKYLIDAVTGRQTGLIWAAAAAMAGTMLIGVLLNSLAGRIGARCGIRVKQEMQADLYQQVLHTEWEDLQGYRSGDLMNRIMGDVNTVAKGVTGFLPGLIRNVTQLTGVILLMLYWDPTMAFISLLGIPASALCSRALVSRMRKHNARMKELSGEMTSFYSESLENLTSIKALDITGVFCADMKQLQNRYREEYLNYNQVSIRTSVFLSLVGMLVSGGCFAWGVYRLWSGAISFGSMTLFLQLASRLGSAFSDLVSKGSELISLSTSAGRIMEITGLRREQEGEHRDFRESSDLRLRLKQVDFAYQTGTAVLSHADLEAGPGELIALTGPSGEGKTTILRLLLGLIHPDGGQAVLETGGEEITLSPSTRSAFAYVPQGNSMFAGTIAENLLAIRPEASEKELEEALETACALDFVKELPGGLNYHVGNWGRGLSEGLGQRLAVARALLKGAPVLLLDEATSALDGATEQKMMENLMHSRLVHTCIFVTHRMGSMKFCTRQYHVEQGTLTVVHRGGTQTSAEH